MLDLTAPPPCPTIDCPGTDSPIENLSAEGFDRPFWFGRYDPGADPILNQTWHAQGCASTCDSDVSQLDADLCAIRQAYLCDNPDAPEFFYSAAQSCTVLCSDGSPFTYTLFAGAFVGLTQLEADTRAHLLACQLANGEMVCMGDLERNICLGAQAILPLKVSGPYSNTQNTWQLIGGAVPDGMAFVSGTGATTTISGTPTVSGPFTFTVKATFPNGNFITRTYTVCVVEIGCVGCAIGSTTLPDYTAGVPYTVTFNLSGCASYTSATWYIVSGNLPAGFTLNPSTGVLSGTPLGSGTFSVRIGVAIGP